MRTTLSIDDDVLAAAKGLAALQHKTVGEVISVFPGKAGAKPTKNRCGDSSGARGAAWL